MTAIMMASIGAAAVTISPLETEITVGQDDFDEIGTDTDVFAYGYNVSGEDYLGLSSFGSITDDVWTDATSTVRTVKALYWTEPCGCPDDDTLHFSVDTTSVPDTDSVFIEIEYNGVVYTRASRDGYTASLRGSTHWRWINVNPNPPSSGVREFIVRL